MPDINFAQIFIAFVVLLFSLTVHESAHAWAASRLGDPTGWRMGRVSLNPAVHIDLVGTLLFPLLAMVTHLPIIGWARSRCRWTRDTCATRGATSWSLRRPARCSNLVLAIAAAAALRVVPAGPQSLGQLGVAAPLALVASRALEINLLLAIFNMLPVPPLDGGTVVAGLLPERLASGLDWLRPYGFLILYGLMLTGTLGYLVGPPFMWMLSWLL